MWICLNESDTLEDTKTARAKQRANGTLKNGAEPLRYCTYWKRLRRQKERITKVSEYTPCKNKNHRVIANRDEHIRITIWKRSRLADQPREGRTGEPKENYSESTRYASTRENIFNA